MGSVRITELMTVSCGSAMPRLPQKRRDHAPPASTTVSQAIEPFSVTTDEMRPAFVSSPRTAQLVNTLPPLRCSASAISGTAMKGSARPSFGRIERALPRPGAAGLQRVRLRRADHARGEAGGLGVLLVPVVLRRQLFLGLAEIEDAAAGEAGLAFDARVHAVPQIPSPPGSAESRAGRGPSGGTSPSSGSTARRRSRPSPAAPHRCRARRVRARWKRRQRRRR